MGSLKPMNCYHFLPLLLQENVSHQQQLRQLLPSKCSTPSSSFPVRCSRACDMHLISVSDLDFNMSKPTYFCTKNQTCTGILRKPT